MTDFKISRTTALWLIKVCTKIMRDATGKNWSPISTQITKYVQNCYFMQVTAELDPARTSWVEAMLSIIKLIACSLAFQVDPHEINPMIEDIKITDCDDISSLNYFE